MGISVVVKNGSGARLLGLQDVRDRVPPPTPPGVYLPLVGPKDRDQFPLLSGVDPYGVTIFNGRQSEQLLVELGLIEADVDDPIQRSLARALKILIAEQHGGAHRLLWFVGD